jgi:tRNA threonylcarbamoyladenosine biosynthesis protein TsaB
MILFIDTSDNKKAIIKIDRKRYEIKSGLASAQNVLYLIKKALDKDKVTLAQLTEIEVNTGPGSFTGLKVGIALANTLGYALGIPVNGKKITAKQIVEPVYK